MSFRQIGATKVKEDIEPGNSLGVETHRLEVKLIGLEWLYPEEVILEDIIL